MKKQTPPAIEKQKIIGARNILDSEFHKPLNAVVHQYEPKEKVIGRAPSKWRKVQLSNPPGTVPYLVLDR